mgnify:FL=1
MTHTLSKMILQHPDTALALGGVGADWLTYGALRKLSVEIGHQLHSCGLGRTDRVVIVLPNGPEMAAAFITLAQWVVTAPLNPNYTQDEFSFYFKDLKSKAVVLPEGYSGPALSAAQALGTKVLRLKPTPEIGAGGFALSAQGPGLSGADTRAPHAEDAALILHTSGTTSRPKIVPLLHRNICASSQHIAASLTLTASDRCLNVMPLFHIHGLLAAVSASLSVGAQIFCTPGFDALRFFGWMTAHRPTWYTAVPTMHQAILSRAVRNESIISDVPLRFLRSSSASLPPQVFAALEDAFEAPVIEAYGMTEAAHQMAANPLPPKPRKPGCVGIAAGPQVRIADESDNKLMDGLGEIVISGPNVTPGYESNPDANAQSFFEAGGNRWFRTGDQGQLDSEGYLTITGRLKEIINRGGEKISPREVDEVLMDHPAVAQAVTFAVPHDKLGEDVAAAVVLAQDETASEQELSGFAKQRLARFKVPRKIVIVEEIPKGATGKLQRIGLHKKLGLEL